MLDNLIYEKQYVHYADTDVSLIKHCMRLSAVGVSKLGPSELAIPGYCSPFTRHLFNNLCGTRAHINYVEVGAFLGASLVAAGYGNKGYFEGIDSYCWDKALTTDGLIAEWTNNSQWSQVSIEEGGLTNEEECRKNIASTYQDNIHLFVGNSTDYIYSPQRGEGIHIFYYDGHHDAKNTFESIMHFEPFLSRGCLLVMDNFHSPTVKGAVYTAISMMNFHLVYEAILNEHFGVYIGLIWSKSQ